MSCLKANATGSLLTGPAYDSRFSGAPDTLPSGAAVSAGLVAEAFSGDARENVPLTRRPGTFVLGSATLSSASPAVETTEAVPAAVYVLAAPGVNAPNAGAAEPSVRPRVAETEPPAVPSAVPV